MNRLLASRAALAPLVVIALLGCAEEGSTDGTSGAALAADRCLRDRLYSNGRCDASCPLPDPDCDASGGVVTPLDGEGPTLCAAVRGNGPRIFAHFGSLARIVEHYGLIDAVAGGSSGSATSLMVESIETSPFVQCEGCSPRDKALRAALLFKSVPAYAAAIGQDEDGEAITTLIRLQTAIRERGIESLLRVDPQEGVRELIALLEAPTFRPLVSTEALQVLRTSPDPVFHARDIATSTRRILAFEAIDHVMFVRPGALSFDALAERLGWMADFYTGYGPADRARMDAFLASCAPSSAGQTWETIAGRPSGATTCGAQFRELVLAYRRAARAQNHAFHHRGDDEVGARMPAIVSTGVVSGEGARLLAQARLDYAAARPVALPVQWSTVSMGYIGQPAALGYVLANREGFTDPKTQRRLSLGARTWRQALAWSLAEPGLSPALSIDATTYSTGGWSDLQPVQVVRNLGCDDVVFITREGGSGSFETGIASALGRTDAEQERYANLTDPKSSFSVALRNASGAWCANWDGPSTTDQRALFAVGYDAPFETQEARFLGAGRYGRVVARTGISGCTIGVADPAPRFRDIRWHRARGEIEALAAANLASGYADGTFRPDQAVTRAEFASLLQRAFVPMPARSTEADFADVAPSHWAYAAINAVRTAGFMSGLPGNKFEPSRTVTRQEVLVALVAGLELTGGDASRLGRVFFDAAEVSPWAVEGVATAEAFGLLSNRLLMGPRSVLRPRDAATRGQVASMIERARRAMPNR